MPTPGEIVGLDWSRARLNPDAIKAAGYTFAIRYLSPLGSGQSLPGQPNPKDVTADELGALLGAGLAVGLVFESYANRALGGSSAGHDDGQTAAARAAQVGYPHECVMFWAVDFPAPAGAFSTLQAYGEGFAAGWAGENHGPYGSGPVIDYVARWFRWRWQTMAWSNGKLSANASVLQRVGHYHPIPEGAVAGEFDENVLLDPAVPFHTEAVVPAPLPSPTPTPVPPAPTPALPTSAWLMRWRAKRGDEGAVLTHLQRWGNERFPAYCAIEPVAPYYGPQTQAFVREFDHRAATDPALRQWSQRLHGSAGDNIGEATVAALLRYGFDAYLARVGFRG